MNTPLIRIRDLSFSYPSSPAPVLDHINLDVFEGEWISIMGPTGAGKSTLSLCLNGLIPNMQTGKREGTVFVCDEDTSKVSIPYLSSKVGVIFQDFDTQLLASQAELEIAFGMENFCIKRNIMKERVHELLQRFSLFKYANRHPAELSGGERQRLAIASVLALSPRVLVLDEPTTDLDPFNKEKLFSIVREMCGDRLTIIWIDHEPELAFGSDRFIVMAEGKIAHNTKFRVFFGDTGLAEGYGIKQPEIPCLFKDKDAADVPVSYDEAMGKIINSKGGFIWKLSEKKQRSFIAERIKASSGKPVIQAEDLEYIYPNGTKALKGIDIEIKEGEFVAVIGQNGSGKTTLAKHLNGLLKPTSGRIIINREDARSKSIYELSKGVGFCFQNPDNQIFASSVLEEVSFGPRNYQLPSSVIERYVAEALESVNLRGYEAKDPFVLTKGERQRIAVASVLSIKPDIMVFDEPTTGLDYKQMTGMMELIKRLNEEGRTIIIITHNMWVAARYAKRCIVMADGRILLDGSTREVFSKETMLKEASLAPPDIVRLGNALGVTALSLEEFLYCLE
ncbi:MAG: ABC transporter ATP-binding protein [bacterium]